MNNQESPINESSSPKETDRFSDIKLRMASNPDTPPGVLKKLAEKEDAPLLERVAENPQTESHVLQNLSTSEAPEVRSAVAENQNAPSEILETLANDESPDVRYRLAENPHAPPEILDTLAEDDNPYIAARAAETINARKSNTTRADDALLAEKYTEAEELYRKLLTDLQRLLGPDHKEVADVLHKLAASLTAQGKIEEASTVEQRAKIISDAHSA